MDRNSRDTQAKQAESKISIERLQNHFRFDLEAGEVWGPRGGRADKLQFFKHVTYSKPPRYKQLQLTFEGKVIKLSAHRAIWSVANGRWPRDGYVIDHINSDTHDNRIANLREISVTENIKLGATTRLR